MKFQGILNIAKPQRKKRKERSWKLPRSKHLKNKNKAKTETVMRATQNGFH